MILKQFDELLDLNLMSESEKLKYIEDLKRECFLCDQFQATAKTELVSIYGALGNENFHFVNFDMAEAVTMQGQHAIKHSEQAVNDYFLNKFHKDRKLLTKLGVPENVEIKPLKNPVVVYIDTDSNYCSFEEIIENVGWKGSGKDLVLAIYKYRLKKYFEDLFKKYVDDFNGMGYYLDFELETISTIGLFIAKKKYIQSLSWKDRVNYDDFSKIKVTGIEIVQRSTPIFCRQVLKELVKDVLKMGGLSFEDGSFTKMMNKLQELKTAHKKSDIELICKNAKINKYEKFVVDDTNSLEIRSKCPVHIKAAATYNYMLNKNNLKHRYNLIKNGDTVKWYYTKDNQNPVFCFLSGYMPSFAPQFNYKEMFEKTVLGVVNRVVNAILKDTELDYSLSYDDNLF